MDHLQEAYFAIYEESEIADRAKRAVGHQRGGTHGDDDAMEKESEESTKSVKKATRHKGPKVTPSMEEGYDSSEKEGAKWNKGQKLKDPRAQKVYDQMTKKKEEMSEADVYDVVLDYLLDEGYADTEDNAITIMANMSEEWIDTILDEAQIMSVSGKGGLKYMINPKILRAQNAAAKEAQGRKAKENAAKETENTERAAKARKTSIERLNAKSGADSGDYDSGYHGDDDTSDGKRHYSLSHTNRSDRKRRARGQ